MKSSIAKSLTFLLLFWLVSMLLATWYGLGWFFFLITIRQIALALPLSRNLINRSIGIKQVTREQGGILATLHIFLQAIIIIAWVALTVIVFLKANIRLIDLLTQFSSYGND